MIASAFARTCTRNWSGRAPRHEVPNSGSTFPLQRGVQGAPGSNEPWQNQTLGFWIHFATRKWPYENRQSGPEPVNRSLLPKPGERSRHERPPGQRQGALAIVKKNPGLKIGSRLLGEAPQAFAIVRKNSRGGLDFNAPNPPPAGDHAIDLDLVFVAVMPETQIRIGPGGQRHDLLHDERFQ